VEHPWDYSAAALFVRSARRAKAGFEVADHARPALVRICRMLEGIPLAIELAAAWVGVLSCSEIAREIEANIDFLATSMRDVPERHRSLRATFDHSWGLLSDAERSVLCRLAVFHGGFDREAASSIAGANLPLLASLVTKSLVWRTEDGRYDLHEVIRQFARSHLSENTEKYFETRDHHSRYI
jgi:predicted ATPase